MRKLLYCFLLFSLSSCDQYMEKKSEIKQAYALIVSAPGSEVKGKITFTEIGEGVRVIADLEGLTPGSHGFHIHEFGRCEGDFTSAGDHFNPEKHSHGSPESENRHAGDLGNIEANEQGIAHYDQINTMLELEGANSIIGKSVIVHADKDDFVTQPSGNSGGRIGCGIIEAVETPSVPKVR